MAMKFLVNLVLLFYSLTVFAQQAPACKDVKTGMFYFYQKNSTDRYVTYRTADMQKEANMVTGDSTVWAIQWIDDCTYSLKLKSTTEKWPADVKKIIAEHKLLYTIAKFGPDYYLFQTRLDKPSNPKISEDTIWLNEKVHPVNTELFKLLRNENEVRKLRDTSKYAILYVYRPGKLTNSLGNYLIFFDSVPLCVASNSSGYIFKILKEGRFPISSRLFKDESEVEVDIKFGQTYYVKSMIHWGISSRLYNFKLEMAKMSIEQGGKEFEDIKNK